MLDFLKKNKDKAAPQEEQFTELKSKASAESKDAAKEAAKKKSTGCCGSCGGQ